MTEQEYQKYLQGFVTYQSEPVGSKVDRAMPFRQAILDGKIHVYLHNEYVRGEFIKQLRSFPLGKHDDIIDACSYGFNWLERYGYSSVISVGRVGSHKRRSVFDDPSYRRGRHRL